MNKSLLAVIPFTVFLLCLATENSIAQKGKLNENTPSEIVKSAIYQTKEKYCRDTLLVKVLGKHYTSVNRQVVHELEEYFSLYPLGWSSENPSLDFKNLLFNWHYKLVNENKLVLKVPYFGGKATVSRYFQTNIHSSIISQQRRTLSFKIARDFLTEFSNYSYIINNTLKTKGKEIIVIDYKPISSGSKWYGMIYINKNGNVITKCNGVATGKDINDNTITEKFTCEYTFYNGIIYPKKGCMKYIFIKDKTAENKVLPGRIEFYHTWEIMDIIKICKTNLNLLNDCKDFIDEYDTDKKEIKNTEYFKNNEDFRKHAIYYHRKFEKLRLIDK